MLGSNPNRDVCMCLLSFPFAYPVWLQSLRRPGTEANSSVKYVNDIQKPEKSGGLGWGGGHRPVSPVDRSIDR